MDVKDKKKKLTLKNFSGGSAAVSSYARGAGNKSVLVEKKKNRFPDWKSFSSDFILNLVSIF